MSNQEQKIFLLQAKTRAAMNEIKSVYLQSPHSNKKEFRKHMNCLVNAIIEQISYCAGFEEEENSTTPQPSKPILPEEKIESKEFTTISAAATVVAASTTRKRKETEKEQSECTTTTPRTNKVTTSKYFR